MIRLGIVDDDAMVRTGLAFILGGEADIEVAWQAANGIEALEHLAAQGADLLLLDIRMPGMDGLATLDALAGRDDRPRVIVLTTFNTDDYVVRALRQGADGFLLKDADPARVSTRSVESTPGSGRCHRRSPTRLSRSPPSVRPPKHRRTRRWSNSPNASARSPSSWPRA